MAVLGVLNAQERRVSQSTRSSSMVDQRQILKTFLDGLTTSTHAHITGAAVIDQDGAVFESQTEQRIDIDRVGATAATILHGAATLARAYRTDMIEEVLIPTESGLLLVIPAGERFLLAVSMRDVQDLNLVRNEMQGFVSVIAKAL
jgi:predicted regulator of Ras-like GTPase activity (Roadblock/LC7/MglB family)